MFSAIRLSGDGFQKAGFRSLVRNPSRPLDSQETCRRTLPIFDGHQRYDLKLAFKRMDKVAAEKGYAGPVVVCSLRYEPIVGHISSNALVKYLSEGREMEVALAPVAGTLRSCWSDRIPSLPGSTALPKRGREPVLDVKQFTGNCPVIECA